MPRETRKEVTEVSDPDVSQKSETTVVEHTPTEAEITKSRAGRGVDWVWYIVGTIDILLALRIFLHLFDAWATGFTLFIYRITDPFVYPFRGIFANPRVDDAFFDTAALVAIIVYLILGWIIARLIYLVVNPTDDV